MGWESDTKRSDGLYIYRHADNRWAIHHRGKVSTVCPCCGKSIPTQRIARIVADAFWPQPNGQLPVDLE